MSDVAIIGAGPYGLSIAAHLRQRTRRFRIFGSPMQTWRERMPAGMRLKSEGFASCLYDPKGEFPLSRFCRERDIPYAPIGLPVELRVFCEYGMEFQRRYVPMLEPARVAWVGRGPRGFEVRLATGETAVFGQVVCAVGIEHYAYVPPALAPLPPSHLSHSSAQADLARFAGQEVAVIGGGASAADCAALLAEAGATTHLLTRRPRLGFHEPPLRDARSASTLYEWPCSGSEMPRGRHSGVKTTPGGTNSKPSKNWRNWATERGRAGLLVLPQGGHAVCVARARTGGVGRRAGDAGAMDSGCSTPRARAAHADLRHEPPAAPSLCRPQQHGAQP